MKSEAFKKARQSISRSLIESLAPGGEWQGPEWWAPSPLRPDSDSRDSFHVFEDASGWCFKDFVSGDGGDIIKLVSLVRSCTLLEAAKHILDETGNAMPKPEPAKAPRAKKPKPAWVPAPDGTKPVHPRIKDAPDLVTPYRLADKRIAFAVLRWDAGTRAPEKEIRPIYPTSYGWSDGIPEDIKKARPILGLHRVATDTRPVLIVEGEKCAQVGQRALPGWMVTTWHGGAEGVKATDWTPLTGKDVTIWPDADEPGRKAAETLAKMIHGAKVLDLLSGHTLDTRDVKGWDIADAITEGMDVEAFLRDCPRLGAPEVEDDPEDSDEPEPFQFLGYERKSYWFLKGAQRIPTQIDMGRFTGSLLGELAPPAWWARRGAINDKGGIDVTKGQQIIIDGETARGFFPPEVLRGSGVWLEDGAPVVNDGDNVVDLSGKSVPIESYTLKEGAVYIRSQLRFDSMTGDTATPAEGRKLLELFEAQGFTCKRAAVALMGWSLIAPFAGVLPWRPIAWLLGKTSNGKSWLLENVVVPLCGEFRYWGSKTTTEAAIRRGTNMIACPVVLDEQTPKTKTERDALVKRVELAKISSGDSSGTSQIASGTDTTVVFVNRSPFLFVGTNFPDVAAEIANRSVTTELRPIHTPQEMAEKIARSAPLAAEVMRDPARYRRRIFRALPRILADIAHLLDKLPPYLGGRRIADVWAPLFAAAWAAQSDESIAGEAGADWLQPYLDEAVMHGADVVEDEDRVVEHILAAQIESDEKEHKAIAEWLDIAERQLPERSDYAGALLSRYGLRVLTAGGRRVLAIAREHDALMRILRDTPYEAGYDAQIRRNELCLNADKPQAERMAGRVAGCWLLDWPGFRKRYMEEDDK